MPWPTPQDYNEAVQNPRECFTDQDLRGGRPELNALGLPRPITGNFASVYRLHCAGRDWAIRCFFREYSDMAERYSAISSHLAASRLPYTVGFEYLEKGIRVRGIWYPILKMEWVEGELLNMYVARNRAASARLGDLASRWLRMSADLGDAGIAHGDLQHGNVLVVGDDFRLVDYDGMFVPALAGRTSHEIGHPNYQHPGRTGHHFSRALDHFSAHVIYLSLRGVQAESQLWDRSGGGDESLLFRQADFACPATSQVFSHLRSHEDGRLRTLSRNLETFLECDPRDVPPVPTVDGSRSERRTRFLLLGSTRTAPQPSPRAPDWVLERLPAVAPRVIAPSPRRTGQLAGIASVIVLVAVGTRMVVPGLPLLAFFAEALILDGAALGAAFLSHPCVSERRALIRRERRAHRALCRLERRVERNERRRALADARFDESMVRVAQRKTRIRADEKRDRDEIDAIVGGRARSFERLQEDIDRAHREAMEILLRTLSDQRMLKCLRRARLPFLRIPDLAWHLRCRLWLKGVRSAADVAPRAGALGFLSPPQQVAVLLWRMKVETAARTSAPREVPRHAGLPLVSKHALRAQRVQRSLSRVDRKQRQLFVAVERRYERQRAAVDDWARAIAREHAKTVTQIDDAVIAARQSMVPHALQLEECQRELEAYSEVRFDRFVLAVFKPW